MKKISVIVPVYNVENYLEKCVHSILKQTYSNLEIILIDDGSTDKSGSICDDLSNNDSRIIVVHTKNRGLSAARNKGIDLSTGEFIIFVDSDDFINEYMIEILYGNLIQNKADISICKFEKVHDNIEILKGNEQIVDNNPIVMSGRQALKQLYKENFIYYVVAWNKLYKRSLFEDLSYREGKIHEDEFIIHHLFYASKTIVFTKIPLYHYVIRDGSITNSTFRIQKLDILDALQERSVFYRENGITECIRENEYNYVIYFFNLYVTALKINRNDKKLKKYKKIFLKELYYLFNNPYFSYKEKLVWVLFIISPTLYSRRYQ